MTCSRRTLPGMRARRCDAEERMERQLRNDFANRSAEFAFQALATGNGEATGIEAELVENGGVNVGDVVAVFDGVEAKLVGRAMDRAALDAAAGHPDGE